MEEVNICELYQRYQSKRKEKKKLSAFFKEQQEIHSEYKKIVDELEVLKAKKKQIDLQIKESCASELEKMEKLRLDIKTDKEMLTDLAVTKMMNNEAVEISDEYNNKFVPFFSVIFKKIN